MASKRKYEQKKPRNWLAVHAYQKTGDGPHSNKKKEESKRACRQKVSY